MAHAFISSTPWAEAGISVSLRLVYEHKALAWDTTIVIVSQMPNYHYQKEMKEKMNLYVDFFRFNYF